MPKLSKFFALLFALAMSLMAQNAFAQQDQAIQRIKSSGVLRVGIAESPPFAIKNPANNTWEGFNVDMANDLAKAMGVKLQIVDSTWPTIISGMMAGQYDVLMASTFATPDRAMSVVFTDGYIIAGELILVHKDAPFQKHEDLNKAGITLSELGGTSNEQTARTLFPKATIRVLTTENQVAPVLEVANKRADANVGDANSIRGFVRANPQAPVRILEPDRQLNSRFRAYSVRPGEYHLLNFLNTWIESQRLAGRLQELKEKWEL
ncbi:transporter substrate-binding domain-containing protein [Bosea sp. (in: a-proteobacteria)]|uniref:transporter substrate-binding domain-containing protein n=1 Tax=Bosea sp. (in: a-proteobacteria) TaxID=1871050 RepID=UPI0026100F69|nr:transporter substrate-binding domain-containing protein [Bosea sp. (in: a-proteobacteria)]MCO5092142.1 transporter substrate-binding domain-containing protein [Bosea sp. (in: a-proteobacteria)]